jgi:hypothetical protein
MRLKKHEAANFHVQADVTPVAIGAWISDSEDRLRVNCTHSSQNSTIFILKRCTTYVNKMIPFGLMRATVAGHRDDNFGIPVK